MGLCKRKPVPLAGKPKTKAEARALKAKLEQNRRIRAESEAKEIATGRVKGLKGPANSSVIKLIRKVSLGDAIARRRSTAKVRMALKTRTTGKAEPKQ